MRLFRNSLSLRAMRLVYGSLRSVTNHAAGTLVRFFRSSITLATEKNAPEKTKTIKTGIRDDMLFVTEPS